MRLHELLEPADLIVDFRPTDKWDAIPRLVEHLAQRRGLTPEVAKRVEEAVLQRERSMSTGIEHGIAVPHAAVEGLDEVIGCMGIVGGESGLSFESIDGRPTRLIVLLAIPPAQKLLHIRTLGDIARVLGKETVRDALLQASGADEAWSVLREND
ncbi:MAG: PTS sugar transporter subunit IIA [Planctomycetes bacterium]|nr:PTS sugar transporter subunit IIA [Planctomycetota bacterium]MCB9905220.1 PTS sugar transporter subunit IIA [Planctomycetota bacterium]